MIQKLEKLKKILNHAKYITTSEFNKFFDEEFGAKLKQVELATNIDVANVEQRVIAKKRKLQTLDLSFFFVKSYFCDNGSQIF